MAKDQIRKKSGEGLRRLMQELKLCRAELKQYQNQILSLQAINEQLKNDLQKLEAIENSLRETNEFNTALLETSPYPIIVTNLDTSVRYVNPAFEKRTGFSREEILGKKSPYPWWPAEYAQQFESENMPGRRKPENPLERQYQKKNSERLWIILNIKPIVAEDRTRGFISNWVDITERKLAEEALKKSEESFRLVTKMAPIPLSTNDGRGNIEFVNDKFTAAFGYTLEDIPTVEVWAQKAFPNEKDRQDLIPNWMEALERSAGKSKILDPIELRVTCKDGSGRIVELYGAKVGDKEIAIFRDVTRRKKAEEQLKQNRMQLSRLFQTMAEGAILWDSSLRIVEVNAEAERIFGLPREQLEGQPYRFAEWTVRPPWQHIRPDGSTKPEEELGAYQALHNRCEIRNVEFGHKWPDGRIIWVNASAVPIFDGSGGVDCVLCTFADVTEQKQLRDEREYYLTQVTKAQEEERKRISRELHDDAAQHLSLLSMGIDHLINQKKEMSQEVLTELRTLHGNAEEALRKIRRVSHELHPSVLENLGLSEALELIIGEFNQQGGTRVRYDIDGEGQRLHADAELALFRITQEALNNIRKHAQATQANVQLKFLQNKVRLKIADNGKGFDIHKESLFAVRRGSIGLVSMKERASLVGAILKLSSSPKTGTSVTVELKN